MAVLFVATLLKHTFADESSNVTFSEQQNILDDPSCPCLRDETHFSTPTLFNSSCLNALVKSGNQHFPSSQCYPLSYGTVCDQHDKNLEPFCNGTRDRPDFCDLPFCFVDSNKCKDSVNHTFDKSNFFPNLFYSYTTCGEKNTFKKYAIDKQLEGLVIRVGMPALEYPNHFRLDEDGNAIMFHPDIHAGVGDLIGVHIDFLNTVAEKANFQVQYEPVSAGAIAMGDGNPWTGCAYDVGRGILDMCVGNFWETSPRRQITQFSTAISHDEFYLRVPLPKVNESLGVEIVKLLQPFTYTLWGTIVIATIGVGLSYTMLDSGKTTSKTGFVGKILGYLYSAMMELLQGSDSSENDDLIARKSVTLTWALFILITVTAYTANLAAFLGENKPMFEIDSLNDCISKQCKMCSRRSVVLEQEMKETFPGSKIDINFDSNLDLVKALADGTCDAAIISKFANKMDISSFGRCNTMFVGNTIKSFKVAWPVSISISEPITYWIGTGVEVGGFDAVVLRYTPPPVCSISDGVSGASTEVTRINVASMAGPLIILGAGITFGLSYHYGNRVLKKTKNVDLEQTTS